MSQKRCGWKRPWHMVCRFFDNEGSYVLPMVRAFPDVNERWVMYQRVLRSYHRCPCALASSAFLRDVFTEPATADPQAETSEP